MKSRQVQFIRNFIMSAGANFLSVLLSAITVLIVPRFVGTETYGYYQLYLFYCSYTAVLNFGWNDGIYLRIGGKSYAELDKNLYSRQIRMLAILELVIYSVLAAIAILTVDEFSRKLTLICVCISAVIVNPRWILVYILQATNEIKKYTTVTVIERIVTVYSLVLIALVGRGELGIQWLFGADLFGKTVATIIIIYFERDIITAKPCSVGVAIPEIKENLSAGMRLMLASLSSMLILGVIRFGIENHWGVETFGKVSLSLSISNMAMQAISAIALVLYPTLRRIQQSLLPELYKVMRTCLMSFGFGVMVFYWPLAQLLLLWLPNYADSLHYIAILLPVCVFEGKSTMLLNTYYKTCRLESQLFKNNFASVIFSIAAIFVAICFDSLNLAVISILLALVSRSVLSEIILSRYLNISVVASIFSELLMTMSFVICNFFFGWKGALAYLAIYIVYVLANHKRYRQVINFISCYR